MVDTIHRYTWSCNFAKSINIETVYVENSFDFLSHFVCPWFCTIDTSVQLKTIDYARFLSCFCKV